MILAQGGVITDRHIDFSGGVSRQVVNIQQALRDGKKLQELLQDVEKQAIEDALSLSNGDALAAAIMLGIEEDDLSKRIERFNDN